MENKEYRELSRRFGPSVWFSNRRYAIYMLREWTSFFVSVFCLIYIYELYLMATSTSAYFALVHNPLVVFFNIIAFAFTTYHALTWFYLIGKVEPIKIGKNTTKPWQALLVNIALLIVIFYIVIVLFGLR
jgi:fumarate reductase subunit C